MWKTCLWFAGHDESAEATLRPLMRQPETVHGQLGGQCIEHGASAPQLESRGGEGFGGQLFSHPGGLQNERRRVPGPAPEAHGIMQPGREGRAARRQAENQGWGRGCYLERELPRQEALRRE